MFFCATDEQTRLLIERIELLASEVLFDPNGRAIAEHMRGGNRRRMHQTQPQGSHRRNPDTHCAGGQRLHHHQHRPALTAVAQGSRPGAHGAVNPLSCGHPAPDRSMELHIRLDGRKGLTDQLYQQLRAGIDSGHLAAGTQLPPTRLLAEQLGVAQDGSRSLLTPDL